MCDTYTFISVSLCVIYALYILGVSEKLCKKVSVRTLSNLQCTVLLEDKTPPWDIWNMSDSSFLARKLSRYWIVHFVPAR